MSLDERLRTDLRGAAGTVDPAAEPALASVHAALRRRERTQRVGALAVVAAAVVLVLGVLAWWRQGLLRGEDQVVVPPPSGTYEARLGGDLAGTWRLRLDGGVVSLVAPSDEALGTRAVEAPYDVRGGGLTLALLAEGTCDGPGRYTWDLDGGLRLVAADDACGLRRRVLTSAAWRPVGDGDVRPGTYEATVSVAAMRSTALAAGFPASDIEAYLVESFPGATSVTYTLSLDGTTWTVFSSADGGTPGVIWSGPYVSDDASTVVAGEPPCGPVTFDVRAGAVDTLSVAVVADDCIENGVTPVGELIAGVTIYEVADYTRVGE